VRLLAVTVDTAEAELVADRCWQAGAEGIWEVPGPDGRVQLRVGVEEPAAAAVLGALGDRSPDDVTELEPFELASRTVELDAAGGPIRLEVPPTVFGDGLHPTTATCLALVAELAGPGTRVLDVGCGSGALSVAAARAGAEVVAVDVDPAAVEATLANAAANGVAVEASTTPLAELGGAFDLVLANISARAVLELADDLRRRCGPGSVLVPSGILVERWGEVADGLGGEIRDVRIVEGWVTAVVAP